VKYSVKSDDSGLNIRLEQVGTKQKELLEEFKECAEGRCTCPSAQYGKLESIEIAPGPDRIDIKLKAQAGQSIEQDDIEKCLQHTTAKVAKSG